MRCFRDRAEAGEELGRRLGHLRNSRPVVLAMPRGGVVVGREVARALAAPLDVIVCRKLGAPGQEEFGFGAVGPGGVCYLDERSVRMLGLSRAVIDAIVRRELAEMQRREEAYRGGAAPLAVRDRTAVLVDDGLATGVTARAAARAVRAQGPRRLVLAVPVAPPDTAHAIAEEVDEVVCLRTPADFYAVGQWYEDFEQVCDGEVVRLLEGARREMEAAQHEHAAP